MVEVVLTLLTILTTGEGGLPLHITIEGGGHTLHTIADAGHILVMTGTGPIQGLAPHTAGLL